MTKRKNPLKDLDSFLKQEASSLVEPEKIQPSQQSETIAGSSEISKKDVLSYFKKLAIEDQLHFQTVLIEVMKEALEVEGMKKASDKMLMNTLLYVQNQDNWKEVIAEYWSAG